MLLLVWVGLTGILVRAQTPTLPTIAISDASVTEGGPGDTNELLFIVTLSAVPTAPVVVDYITLDGSARGATDYQSRTGKLTFVTFGSKVEPYELRVRVNGDNTVEPNESLIVRLSNPTNAVLRDAEGTGIILNDDGATLRIEDASVTEPDTNNTVMEFNVVLSGVPTTTVSVGFSTVTGTAGTTDFKAETGRLVFAPGETRKKIPITVYGDRADEADETFQVRLSAPLGASLLRSQGIGTILDNDIPALSIASAVISEGDLGFASQRFNVRLSPASVREVRVQYEVVAGTATPDVDFVPSRGTLIFPPGIAVRPIDVQFFGDLIDEPNETFVIRLSAPQNATLAVPEATGTILDDDPAPTLRTENITVTEGDAGEQLATFVLRLSAPSENEVRVDFQTADTTAVAGTDYLATNGVAVFPPGIVERQIQVPILGDTADEPEESFVVVLSGAVNALVDPTVVRCRIVDDDPPELRINDAEVVEGDTGVVQLVFRLQLSSVATEPVAIEVATTNLTAEAGVDYEAFAGRLELAPGQTNGVLSIPVQGDTLAEGDEAFGLLVLGVANARLLTEMATGVIHDDDLPVVSFGDLTVLEGTGSEPTLARLSVEVSQASSQTIGLSYQTQAGSALADLDFTAAEGRLEIPAGETTAELVFRVAADAVREAAENFFVRFSSPTNATLERDLATITIADDDAVSVLSVANVEVDEGDDSVRDFGVIFRLSAPTDAFVSAVYRTADDTAVAGRDYFRREGQVVFDPGQTEVEVAFAVVGDRIVEPDEQFHLELSSPVNVVLERAQIPVLIHDDDGVRPTNAPPQVALIEPLDGAVLELGAAWSITALVSDTNGVPGTVTNLVFYADGERLGEVSQEPFRLTLPGLPEGRHVLTARATDNGGLISTSAPVVVTVEGLPQVRVAAVQVGEAESPARFQVSLSRVASTTVTVNIATVAGSAAADRDFVSRAGSLVFKPGETNQVFEVTIIDDPVREHTEDFGVTLSGAVGALLIEPTALATILDNDPDPLVDVADVAIREGETNGVVRVIARLSHPSSDPIQFAYATTNRTATAGSDYGAVEGVWVVPAGAVSAEIQVPILGDDRFEEDEVVVVLLTSVTNAILARPEVSVTLLNDDNAPVLQVSGGDVVEGHEGRQDLVFVFRRVGPTDLPVSFDVSTVDGTALAGLDYVATNASVRFPAETNVFVLRVPVLGDRVFEEDENFLLRLAHPVNCALERVEIPGWIRNDDGPPTLTAADVRVNEGDVGETLAVFTLTLSAESPLPATVRYETAGGTATADVDYTTGSGVITFPPGTTTNLLTVRIQGDRVVESTEDFLVRFTAVTNAVLERTQVRAEIVDDDVAVTNRPPVAEILQPRDRTVLGEGESVVVQASATDSEGPIARVVFRVDGVEVAEDREAPYAWTWGNASPGDHRLEVVAYDAAGSAGQSRPVRVAVSDVCGRVAILAEPGGLEAENLLEALFELGVNGRAFGRGSATHADLDGYDLVVWDDEGAAVPTEADVTLLESVVGDGKALYFIGDALVNAGAGLSPAAQTRWEELIRVRRSATARFGVGVEFASERLNPDLEVIYREGKVGTIPDFAYAFGPAVPASLGAASDTVLAQSATAEVLVAFVDEARPLLGRRVTQAFRVGPALATGESAPARRLFQNAVWWLLNCRRCSNLNLTPQLMVSAESGRVGGELIYTLQVLSAGGCEALAVRVALTFPPSARVLRAQTGRGTWSEQAGEVTFYLGRLARGAEETLEVALAPGEPGDLEMVATLHSLNENFGALADNEVRLTTPITGAPNLTLTRLGEGDLEILVRAPIGGRYRLESAPALAGSWVAFTNIVMGTATTRVTVPRGAPSGARFYRARE